jgi:hypothetical protein
MRLIDLYNIKEIHSRMQGEIIDKLFPVRRYVSDQEQFIYSKITGSTDTETMLETKDLLKYNKVIPTKYFNTIGEGVYSIFDDLMDTRRNEIAQLLQTGSVKHHGEGKISKYGYDIKILTADIEDEINITIKDKPIFAIMSDSIDCNDIYEKLSFYGFTVLSTKYFKNRTVTFVPNIPIGNLLVGVTPGEAEMLNGIDYSEMSADNSINITLTECKGSVETKMEQLFLPMFKEDITDKITTIKF